MNHEAIPHHRRTHARRMRRAMTPAELKFWNAVRAHRFESLGFRRQFPIGGFIVDFACPEHRLVIELDGSQHGRKDEIMRDAQRTRQLEASGWTVLRFWNDDVLKDTAGVCAHVLAVISDRPATT